MAVGAVMHRGNAVSATLMIAPAVTLYLVFTAWPLLELGRLSLLKTDFITSSWAGLGNYAALATDATFLRSAANSGLYILLLVPGQVGVGLLIALAAFRLPKRWHDFSRVAFYVPMLAAGVIVAQVWRWVWGWKGPANWAIGLLGSPPVSWLSDTFPGIPALCLVLVTSATGQYVIMLLAAMLSVDRSILEAAEVDGASRSQIRWRILVPSIWPMLTTCMLLAAIAAPQVYETIAFLAPYESTSSLTYEVYTEAFRYSRHGSAASMAVVLMVLTAGMTWAKTRTERE